MSSSLHLILSSSERCLNECRETARACDQTVLVDAGVEHLARPDYTPSGDVVALEIDVSARGLGKMAAALGVSLISDDQWLELVQSHQHCLSWK